MDKRNRPALGFLLVAVGAVGRALLAVPEAASLAELTLGMLMVIGYLVLVRTVRLPVLLGAAGLVLELILCGAGIDPTALSTVLLRLADLWLLYAAITCVLRHALALCPDLYGRRTAALPVVSAVVLSVQSAAQLAAVFVASPPLTGAVTGLFIVFSCTLLVYAVLLLRAYNALRVRKEPRRQL